MEDLAVVETRSSEVLDEASHMIFNKLFAKSDELYFQERIDELTKRLKELLAFSDEEKKRFACDKVLVNNNNIYY